MRDCSIWGHEFKILFLRTKKQQQQQKKPPELSARVFIWNYVPFMYVN
jgi:hypothetical protein